MKNIIKILVFLISVITYAQVQPVNYYQQFNKVNEADENDSIQVLVRTVGNPDHNIMKYVSASDIGGGSGDMPDVSATERGVVNNEPLQELGGVDKLINGVRIGRGANNNNASVALGRFALDNTTTSIENTAIGAAALRQITSGSSNTGVGIGALMNTTTGSYNSAIGGSTLLSNTTGTRNVAVGTSLYYNSTGSRNTGIGFNAGYGATTGQQNTYIGNQSGYNNGVGSYNTAIGSRTMITTGTGTTASTLNMNNNVFIGAGLTLADGVNNVLAIDNKGATNTNYANALLYGNFADRFLRINGRFEIAPSTMPVADAGFTKKLVWNPTTGVVAETDDTGGEQQFVQITEGGKTGWGLKYKVDNPNYYGNIGSNAIDLGYSNTNSTTIGATGNSSTVSGGNRNTASSQYSTVSGGVGNVASSSNSTVSGGDSNTASGGNSIVSGGLSNIASGDASTISGGGYNTASNQYTTVSGGGSNTASGQSSTISGGSNNTANSYGEWVGGINGTIPTGQSASSWVATDRLFNIGNGTNPSLRSNAFTILKNGLATLPSVTNTLIDAEPTGKAVVTREWFEANSGGTTPTLAEVLAEGNNAGEEVIQFEYDDGEFITTFELGLMDIPTGMGTQKELSFGRPSVRVTPFGFFQDLMGHNLSFASVITQGGGGNFNSYYIDSDGGLTRGLVGSSYFGENYNDNTYVQKKYVDDNFLPLPTEGTSGQVLTTDGAGVYTWEDVEVQTYLQSITGYDAGETQTLKNINGVMTWVTD